MLVAGLLTVFDCDAVRLAACWIACVTSSTYRLCLIAEISFLWEGEHFRLAVFIVLKLFFYSAVLTVRYRVKHETVQYAHKNLTTFKEVKKGLIKSDIFRWRLPPSSGKVHLWQANAPIA